MKTTTATAAPARTCSVDGCEKPRNAKGLCSMHRWRLANKGTLGAPAAPESRVCLLEGCARKHYGKGLCQMHWQQLHRRGGSLETRTCRADGCAGVAYARSRYCLEHARGLVCAQGGCSKPSHALGYCSTHYAHATGRSVPVHPATARDELGRKRCSRCEQWKPEREFYAAKASDGLASQCKACHRARVRAAKYGLAPEGFRAMFAAQGGRCASCGDEFTEDRLPVIDHDHGDGHVRGLLCGHCNSMLGMALDSPERLRAAAEYLERDRSTQADA